MRRVSIMKNEVNILGTSYSIAFKTEAEDVKLQSADGYCDFSIKSIVVGKFMKSDNSMEDLEDYTKKVLRHEIIHAFLYESGLSSNSWADNEEIVDFFAIQYHKIDDIFGYLEL
jgi:hypothetical protein